MSRKEAFFLRCTWVEGYLAHLQKYLEEMSSDIAELRRMADEIMDDDTNKVE